ncbi:MAG: hypothetical protein AB2A00_27265 [Myxococcota bacterium]
MLSVLPSSHSSSGSVMSSPHPAGVPELEADELEDEALEEEELLELDDDELALDDDEDAPEDDVVELVTDGAPLELEEDKEPPDDEEALELAVAAELVVPPLDDDVDAPLALEALEVDAALDEEPLLAPPEDDVLAPPCTDASGETDDTWTQVPAVQM